MLGLMIHRLFVMACLTTMACAPLHADEQSLKISLGIRDNTFVTLQKVEYPLAFRIENTRETVIKDRDIPSLFFKGIAHVLPKGGKEEQTTFQTFWRTSVYDL